MLVEKSGLLRLKWKLGVMFLGKEPVPFLIMDREFIPLFGDPKLHFKNCFHFGLEYSSRW